MSHPERLQKQVEDLKTRPRYAFSRTWVTQFHTNTPYEWSKGSQNVSTVGHMITIMAPRHLLHHVPYRPFFVTVEDYDHYYLLEDYCRPHNKGVETHLFNHVLPHPLYAVRHASQTSRVSGQPLGNIYTCLIYISSLHRKHHLPDPIDNARTIGDATHAIHPRFPRVLDQEPNLAQKIADCLLAFALRETFDNSTDAQANYRTLLERCFPQKNLTFHSSTNGLDKKLTLLKYHLHHAIRYNQTDSYRNSLYALIRFFPKRTAYTIAHKILFACLRRGRFSFIMSFLKTCLRIKP